MVEILLTYYGTSGHHISDFYLNSTLTQRSSPNRRKELNSLHDFFIMAMLFCFDDAFWAKRSRLIDLKLSNLIHDFFIY
ncbi:hypothetical protein E2C01_057211 [Portunus trituberculatus]|uniref:Uncharacterized protein n=1 Tax=Portunus trituberculatus TaxID=210409 RepID=A0A5B7H182_PORTR|nr:hypothetical protein [Portunus trituberculatus]